MNSKRKLPKKQRNVRHVFIYINVLRTDMGMTFKEITRYLNDDNYRTRDGLPYTEKQVMNIWGMRKGKYKLDYVNYQKYIPPPVEIEAKKMLLKYEIFLSRPFFVHLL